MRFEISTAFVQNFVNSWRIFDAYKHSLVALSRSFQTVAIASSRVDSVAFCDFSNSFTFVFDSAISLRTSISSSMHIQKRPPCVSLSSGLLAESSTRNSSSVSPNASETVLETFRIFVRQPFFKLCERLFTPTPSVSSKPVPTTNFETSFSTNLGTGSTASSTAPGAPP